MVTHATHAWRIVSAHPVGVLAPAGALLLVQVLLAWLAWSMVRPGPPYDAGLFGGAAGLAVVLWFALTAPLRAAMIGAGARSLGLVSRPGRRWLSLLGVHLVVHPLQLAVALLAAVAGAAGATVLAAHGWLTLAAFVGFLGAFVGLLGGLGVRALFAYAPIDVVVGERSAASALVRSARLGWRDTGTAFALLAASDLVVAVGALACGAGALPGVPLGDMAILHRWHTTGHAS